MSVPRLVRLGDVSEITMGQAPPGSECNAEGQGTIFVKAGEFGERRPIVRTWTTRPLKLARRGDALVCVVGATAGKVNEGIDCAIGRSVAAVRSTSSDLLPVYLYRFLTTQVLRLRAQSQGMAQGVITRAMLQHLEIPLPSVEQQQRICEVLEQAEALRAKRRAALALMSELRQSLFLSMFGDPAQNPMGWRTQTLGEMLESAEVFTDGDWVESKDQDPNGDVRLVQLADVGDGVYLDKSARYLTRSTANRLRCTFLQPGDVLIARMPDPLGRACLFPGDERSCVTVVDVCVVRPREEGPDPVWFMSCLNTPGFREQIARQATGTTRERISRGNLGRLPIISPPIGAQREFASRAAALAGLCGSAQASLGTMTRLFASLQQHAFGGDL